jgi:hypothetical protein
MDACMRSLNTKSLAAIVFLSAALFLQSDALGGDASVAKAQGPRKSVKLLTIGNSFADNAMDPLPELAKAGGKQLTVFRANLGGHSLGQHAGYLLAYEKDSADPKGRAYKKRAHPVTGEKKDFSLREALQSMDWDVVTIQQASPLSFKPETYQPHAGILIDYIRKYAPKAEILIFQTWAYPDDYYPKFQGGGGKLDQETMYKGLVAAYQKLSDETHLRMIPVGDAFQAARALPNPISLNIKGDRHANNNGKYLAAAVFYEMIFRDNVEAVSKEPKTVSPEDAKVLRRVAHETIAKSAQQKNDTKSSQ